MPAPYIPVEKSGLANIMLSVVVVGVFLRSTRAVMFVSVSFVSGVLLVSRACPLEGDVLSLILGGILVVTGLLGVTIVYKLTSVEVT